MIKASKMEFSYDSKIDCLRGCISKGGKVFEIINLPIELFDLGDGTVKDIKEEINRIIKKLEVS